MASDPETDPGSTEPEVETESPEIQSPEHSYFEESTEGPSDVECQESKKSPNENLSRIIRMVECFLLVLSVLFVGFTALSTPVIHPFYLFSLDLDVNASVDKVSGKAEFGIWGFCTTGVSNTVGLGPLKHTSQVSGNSCSNIKLGWTFADVPGLSQVAHVVSDGLTGALLLNLLGMCIARDRESQKLILRLSGKVVAFVLPTLCVSVLALLKPDLLVKKSQAENPECDSKDEGNSGENIPDNEKGDTCREFSEEQADGRRKLTRMVALAASISFIFIVVVALLDLGILLWIQREVAKVSDGAVKLSIGCAFYFVIIAAVFILLALLLALVNVAFLLSQRPFPVQMNQVDEQKDDENDVDDEGRIDSHFTLGTGDGSNYSDAEGEETDEMVDVPLDESDESPPSEMRN
ncbi:hypothetical protein M0805_003172 [Coniferiporia weirii]|nr:hypothetical protein M0805_003172 [Coniferiporia weirii]